MAWLPLRLALIAAIAWPSGCERQRVELDYGGPVSQWEHYGGTEAGMRFSPLTQIARENVSSLEVAWVHRSGDWLDGSRTRVASSFQATPIVAEGTLYYCTPLNRVFALDPESGELRWSYDPQVDVSSWWVTNCRGLSSWVDAGSTQGPCRHRIFVGTLDARLVALDGRTGEPCPDFGQKGVVDLGAGVGSFQPGEYGVTSPPLVLGDRVITGSYVLDNVRLDMPSGVVRAYHARSGALLWAWEAVPPRPPAAPVASPQTLYRRGTANAWAVLSADARRGLVFVPTGNTSPDYFGGLREGLDRYSSSLVALDAQTGRVVWHFQTVHHDVWDYDVAAQPVLFEFPAARGAVPAVVQATKTGHLFFLNRETGEPLFAVEERPVPQDGAAPGESLSPTQPFPTHPPPLHPSILRPEDAWGFSFWDRGKCREAIAALRSEGIFTPPSTQGTVQFPGNWGGVNWGGAAIDPERGILVVNTLRVAAAVRLIPRAEFERRFAEQPAPLGFEPQHGTPYALERHPLLSPLGAPCNPPPWGTLVGIELASGAIRWEVPLGTTRDMAPFPIWRRLGVPNLGGPLVTASGLTFVGATTDKFLRAFDTSTGQELWKARLPAAAQATPMTYRLRPSSRQFVVIAAGGHAHLGTDPGDFLMAFALPE